METNELFGYISAVIIGVILGLIGGGGSILTVPVLVYLLHIEPVLATGYSLFVVGCVSAVSVLINMRRNLVDFRAGILFAIPATVAVYLTRTYLVPAIPDTLFSVSEVTVTKAMAIMVFFALIMTVAGASMIRGRKSNKIPPEKESGNALLIVLVEGFVVGTLTGLVGAGGGFLIIPVLVLVSGLPIKKAIATSLLIIAIKSLIGFIGDVQTTAYMDWQLLLLFTGLAVTGIPLGIYLQKFIDNAMLKKGFGWFVLAAATYIILKETV